MADTRNQVQTKWSAGHFQAHFIYTGVAESIFLLFPDGTSMLLDCGDHPAITRLHLAVPVKPGPGRLAGDWIARYVARVNPLGRDVDYLVVSHFHSDHTGTPGWQSSAPFGDYPGSPGTSRITSFSISGINQASTATVETRNRVFSRAMENMSTVLWIKEKRRIAFSP